MAMRALGIGPAGSLLAAGELNARDRVLITDFAVSNGDSSLGARRERRGARRTRAVGVVTLVHARGRSPRRLQRMQQPPTARVDSRWREIAPREGVKAIVDGDVTRVGSSYIVPRVS